MAPVDMAGTRVCGLTGFRVCSVYKSHVLQKDKCQMDRKLSPQSRVGGAGGGAGRLSAKGSLSLQRTDQVEIGSGWNERF